MSPEQLMSAHNVEMSLEAFLTFLFEELHCSNDVPLLE